MRYVMISSPEYPTRVVRCDGVDECLDVVATEADTQPNGAIFNLMEVRKDSVVPIARWAKVRGKLVRGQAPRRRRR